MGRAAVSLTRATVQQLLDLACTTRSSSDHDALAVSAWCVLRVSAAFHRGAAAYGDASRRVVEARTRSLLPGLMIESGRFTHWRQFLRLPVCWPAAAADVSFGCELTALRLAASEYFVAFAALLMASKW